MSGEGIRTAHEAATKRNAVVNGTSVARKVLVSRA